MWFLYSPGLINTVSSKVSAICCFVWKAFSTFPAHLRMSPVSRGNSRGSLVCGATCQKTPILWSSLHKNPCPDTSSKATLWMKSQHEGALTTPCIIWKNPQVPHTARQVACHLVNNLGGKQSSIPPHKTRPDSPVRTLQRNCDPSQIWPRLNRQGDSIQPGHTPFPIWNQSVVPCPVLTVAS